MPKLSIVIPVYNVEDYIRKCLNSIIEQTFTDFEVICVDDGSTDFSGMLCDRYHRIDKRFKVIHQENSGVSSARNRGIYEASGDWLTFVDPDDWIHNEYYERLFEAQQKFDADVAHCRTCVVTQKGKRVLPKFAEDRLITDELQVFQGKDEIMNAITLNILNCLSWNKIYRRELWGETKFPEELSLGEDMSVVVNVVAHSNVAVYVPNAVYYYRNRNTSLLHSGITIDRLKQDLRGSETMRKQLEEFAPEYEREVEELKLYYDFGCVSNYVMQGKGTRSALYSLMNVAPLIRESCKIQKVKKLCEAIELVGRGRD